MCEAAAREEAFKEKEAEFSALADETTGELDRVIRQVKMALGSVDNPGNTGRSA